MTDAAKATKEICGVCGTATVRPGHSTCSEKCEIVELRDKLQVKSERLARGRERRPALHCLAQVVWSTCLQEWYPRDSYDAKRRAHELRGAGYICIAKHVGQMPIRYGNGMRLIQVTLLTAWRRDGSAAIPDVHIKRGLQMVEVRAGD